MCFIYPKGQRGPDAGCLLQNVLSMAWLQRDFKCNIKSFSNNMRADIFHCFDTIYCYQIFGVGGSNHKFGK